MVTIWGFCFTVVELSEDLNWFFFLCDFAGASGLSDVQIKVPVMVRSGDSAILTCNYDLDAELYTIKWYLDTHEFYRFTPSDTHKSQSFNVRDITIDVSSICKLY